MTSDQPSTPDDDIALALAAIEEYFAEQVAGWEAVVEDPAEDTAEDTAENRRWLASFRDRLAHVRAGGRLTDHDAAQVYAHVVFARMRGNGAGSVAAARADRYAAERRAQAVGRGLTALGYDLTHRTDLDRRPPSSRAP